jgi:hypothetical protein
VDQYSAVDWDYQIDDDWARQERLGEEAAEEDDEEDRRGGVNTMGDVSIVSLIDEVVAAWCDFVTRPGAAGWARLIHAMRALTTWHDEREGLIRQLKGGTQ